MKGKDNPAKYEDIRRKISEGKGGRKVRHTRPLSEKQLKHLERLAKERKGKHHSADTRLKISGSRKGKCMGEDNPMFGRQHTKETKEKIKIQFPCCSDISKITHIPVTTIRNWVLHGTKPRSTRNGVLI